MSPQKKSNFFPYNSISAILGSLERSRSFQESHPNNFFVETLKGVQNRLERRKGELALKTTEFLTSKTRFGFSRFLKPKKYSKNCPIWPSGLIFRRGFECLPELPQKKFLHTLVRKNENFPTRPKTPKSICRKKNSFFFGDKIQGG